MSDTKPTVSIGIPAYNEEANIQQLLTALLEQDQDTFELLEIIVASDGSTDQTVPLAHSFRNPKIKVLDNKDRQGQAARQNQIVTEFNGEILVLLNADVLPANKTTIHNLVQPFINDTTIGLVSCAGTQPQAKTFIESILNFSKKIVDNLTIYLNNSDNVYLCHGYARAFRKDFAKQIHWPDSVGEDAYSYFFAKKQKVTFYYQPSAVILYRLPQTLKDHYKQSVRFGFSQNKIAKLFPDLNTQKEYEIPKSLLLKSVLKYFFINPIYTVAYVFIQIGALFNPYKVVDTNVWEPSQSSKNLS